ncbi:MAG: phosphate ABC transporter permease PstA [Clostridiales bacterium]
MTDETIEKSAKKNISNRKLKDRIVLGFIWFCSFITIASLIWLIAYIVYKGFPELSLDYIFNNNSGKKLQIFSTIFGSNNEQKGIFQFILNTIYIVILSITISAPIGISAAVYLIEYSKPGPVVNVIRFTTETLAGIPSIIYGLFGFIVFVTMLHMKFSVMAGSLTLSIMVLPTIIRATEEALKCVPDSFREGSLALGATKLITIVKLILPSAIPGIITAVILSIGRIVGETAAVYFTAGYGLNAVDGVFDSARTLSVHLFYMAKEGLSIEQSYATGSVLLVIIIVINFTTNIISKKFTKKYT